MFKSWNVIMLYPENIIISVISNFLAFIWNKPNKHPACRRQVKLAQTCIKFMVFFIISLSYDWAKVWSVRLLFTTCYILEANWENGPLRKYRLRSHYFNFTMVGNNRKDTNIVFVKQLNCLWLDNVDDFNMY